MGAIFSQQSIQVSNRNSILGLTSEFRPFESSVQPLIVYLLIFCIIWKAFSEESFEINHHNSNFEKEFYPRGSSNLESNFKRCMEREPKTTAILLTFAFHYRKVTRNHSTTTQYHRPIYFEADFSHRTGMDRIEI